MVGLDSAGKTTILYKLRLGEVVATCPTIGFNLETVKFKNFNLVMWDVSGDQRTRRFWKTYYKDIQGVIFVIDAEDRQRFQSAKEELFNIFLAEELRGAPILILANKQDLPNAMEACELAEKLELYRVRDRHWHLQATCALSGDGLSQGITRLVQMISGNKY